MLVVDVPGCFPSAFQPSAFSRGPPARNLIESVEKRFSHGLAAAWLGWDFMFRRGFPPWGKMENALVFAGGQAKPYSRAVAARNGVTE